MEGGGRYWQSAACKQREEVTSDTGTVSPAEELGAGRDKTLSGQMDVSGYPGKYVSPG